MHTTIETEIRTAVGLSDPPSDNRQAYLQQLVELVNEKLSEEQWAALPDPVQRWVNAAVSSINNEELIQDFPDDYSAMSLEQLTNAFNSMATGNSALGINPIKRFKDKKTGIERCTKLLEQLMKKPETVAHPPVEEPATEEELEKATPAMNPLKEKMRVQFQDKADLTGIIIRLGEEQSDVKWEKNGTIQTVINAWLRPAAAKEKSAAPTDAPRKSVSEKTATTKTRQKANGEVKWSKNRTALLNCLQGTPGEFVSEELLLKAVYVSKNLKNCGALKMVIKGFLMTVEKHQLPMKLVDNGRQTDGSRAWKLLQL